jgi:tRNA (guanine37-N1)-methyltransferase
MPRAPGFRVPTRHGQQALNLASTLQVLDRTLKIKTNQQTLSIPLTRALTPHELTSFTQVIVNTDVLVTEFSRKSPYPRSLLDTIVGQIPRDLHEYVPKSMDVIGRVALVKIPPELDAWTQVIGQAILAVNRHLDTVLAKIGNVEGERRLRRYEVLAGSDNTYTVHKEYGCIYHVDPRTVYFSPRLSEERQRIAALPRAEEVIVDMFASIGSFALQIATTTPRVTIYAIDINPAAYRFLQHNIAANHVAHMVYPRLGDVRDVAKAHAGTADRAIMDLPEAADDFVDVACLLLKPTGGVIHFYGFAAEPTAIETIQQRLQTRVHQAGRQVHAILYARKIRPIAPRRWQIVIDACVQ